MLRPNYEKPKDAYASSKWPNKDRTTLNLPGKDASLPICPSRSNQRQHDDHYAIRIDHQINSRRDFEKKSDARVLDTKQTTFAL